MKVCPQCGLENPDHAQSCAECDADLYEVRASRPAQPRESESKERPQPFQTRRLAPRKTHRLRTLLLVIAVIAVVAAVVAITQSGEEAASPSATVPLQSPTSRALEAPLALLELLCSGAQEGITMTPIRGATVRSDDYVEVYFIAMEFSANGVENQVGVWSTNDLSGGGMISAVDRTAEAFTVWPYGGGGVSMSDDGAEEARAALGAD